MAPSHRGFRVELKVYPRPFFLHLKNVTKIKVKPFRGEGYASVEERMGGACGGSNM